MNSVLDALTLILILIPPLSQITRNPPLLLVISGVHQMPGSVGLTQKENV